MAIETYTLPEDRTVIVHETKVDFNQRCLQKTIHIMQYDKSLPIISVKLFSNGEPYVLPESAELRVRWGKRDRTFVYKEVLGCDETRQIAYFDVDEQMSYFDGPCNPILELTINGKIAGSSYIPFNIDRNPIQNTDIESHSEYPEVVEVIEDVRELKQNVSDIKDVIPGNATPENHLATMEDIQGGTHDFGDLSIKDGEISQGGNKELTIEADGNITIASKTGDVSIDGYYTSAETDTELEKINTRVTEMDEEYTQRLTEVENDLTHKQDTLVSGENIKTVNGESLLGEGNIEIEAGSAIHIGDDAPTDGSVLWIDTSEDYPSGGGSGVDVAYINLLKDVIDVDPSDNSMEIAGSPVTFYSDIEIKERHSLKLTGEASVAGIYFEHGGDDAHISKEGISLSINSEQVNIGCEECRLTGETIVEGLLSVNTDFNLGLSKTNWQGMMFRLRAIYTTLSNIVSNDGFEYLYNLKSDNLHYILQTTKTQADFDKAIANGTPILYSMGKLGNELFGVVSYVWIEKNSDGTYQLREFEQ